VNTHIKGTWWMSAVGVAATIAVAGCDRVKAELLAPQNPGLVDPTAINSPTSALALRVGALGRYKQLTNGNGNESIWQYAGTLADEFKNADFANYRIGADQRLTDASVSWNYAATTQSRGFVRDAIVAMKAYNPDSSAMIAELYAELAFFEMTMADNYCNGIPLGHTEDGVRNNGEPLTIMQVYDSAANHLDTAMALSARALDSNSVYINRLSRVLRARVLIDKSKVNAGAAAALVGGVPTGYAYDMTFSSASGANGMWSLNNSTARISVADSFDVAGGVTNLIKNALPFASANDPRVPVINGDQANPKVLAEDQVTRPFYLSLLYTGQFDPLVLASGVDARLYEAEAKLQAGDVPGMMAILNALRQAKPTIGVTTIPSMPPLATPFTLEAATTLLFREKAFWTFGRGHRLPDLRRLIRQYGRTQDKVFPTGLYFKGGSYGADVNFPVPSSEAVNPLFHGCLDRQA
jgi:hypothetical protein